MNAHVQPPLFDAGVEEEHANEVEIEIFILYVGFDYLLEKQLQVEEAWSRDVDPDDPVAVSAYVRDVVLCATDELHEVLGEVNWKPWKNNSGIKNLENYREEMADVLHFILDLYLAAGLTGKDIVHDYLLKHRKNLERVNSTEYKES